MKNKRMQKIIANLQENYSDTLKGSAHTKYEKALPYKVEIAKAFVEFVRETPLVGDVVTDIFTEIPLSEDEDNFRVPLDLIAPGDEGEYTAFTIPETGYVPQRGIEGDEVRVPSYQVANSIDWGLRFSKRARWDVVTRAMEIYFAGYVKKRNNDAWRLLITSGADRNVLVFDADASAGQLTRRLFSIMNVTMKRNGGGNSASLMKSRLTDFWVSPEGMEDIRHWDLSQVPDGVREQMFVSPEGQLVAYPGVNLHELYELGVGQEYQLYYTNDVGGAMGGSDVEIVVGLDRQFSDSFVMPSYGGVQTFPASDELHRSQRDGVYGWDKYGLACLDNRRVILGSF